MNSEHLPDPVSFERHLSHKYVALPSVPSRLDWTGNPNIRGGHYFMTRPSETVEVSYNPETVLAPDPISDAFGRMAAFALGDFYTRGGARDLLTRESMANCFGGNPEDYLYAVNPGTKIPESILDLGSGPGIFAVGLLDAVPVGQQNLRIDVVDNDATALLTADRNIRMAITQLHSAPEVHLKPASWLEGAEGQYNVIYFNPPYLAPDHEISSPEAALAPEHAIRVADAWQEYEKVLPYIPTYLGKEGIAIIRLPREPDEAMFKKLSELCGDMKEPYRWMFVETIAGEQRRQGFGLLIVNDRLPARFGEYDYNQNYLNGKYKPYAEATDTMAMYGDAFCEVNRIKRPVMEAQLGMMEELEGGVAQTDLVNT